MTKKLPKNKLQQKKSICRKKILKLNASFFSFPKTSCFFFESLLSSYHYSKLLEKNLIKPNNNEISILKNNINDKSKNPKLLI